MDTLLFILISQDQPSALEFTQNMVQLSSVPLLESALQACDLVHIVKFHLVGTTHFCANTKCMPQFANKWL